MFRSKDLCGQRLNLQVVYIRVFFVLRVAVEISLSPLHDLFLPRNAKARKGISLLAAKYNFLETAMLVAVVVFV